MPWNRTDPSKERMMLVAAQQRGTETMTALCQTFGISRKTGYKWLHRVAQEGPVGCQEHSRAPQHHPHAVPALVRDALRELRLAHPTWGPRKLLAYLEATEPAQAWPAASTIGTCLVQAGLVRPRRTRRRTPPYRPPFQACQGPNDVWCADFKGWFRTGDGRRCDPLTISDAYSRMLLRCTALSTPTLAQVRPIFVEAFAEYGLPLAIRTDNGTPFASSSASGLSALSLWWLKLGIRPERIRPGHPEENGRHERMHKTLKAETAAPPKADQVAQQAAFACFQQEYNTMRPHEALGQRPPSTHYVSSPRSYPRPLESFTYPYADAVRHVGSEGTIRWQQHRLFLSEVLAGEPVGLYQRASGLWEVRLGPLWLGTFDNRDPAPRVRPSQDPWRQQ